ncbi:tRNA dimethylallyltransferase [Robbsia andropogonis]|uniref:tRNA (adenosine(37)-N6)-dimethylallyltransferase MiaA n=1 Tax=Robbsia andropogonis TaxID=28092 RepID=UPI00209E0786|nr:tRNA (adenosine(37)-N6)-dimethylallyltransferase MiaA [Robbsia andropogonis]MCP1118399.1 tRNA (adenosine(37)-N6)-dimethylallyltransferase MiaA [Robbsia andropogonis]MCP1127822.1 tRNA (adenosine(37)-N6)-dimethylallyltransferase MiaA [Robbsia andropogonis]
MTAASASLPVVCVLGPTASGKTATALAVARHERASGRAVELISLDSALVFRDMDIGTAKPSIAERADIPHWLIDIRDPRQAYSAAEFRDDALRLITEIRARGAQPVIVGGTMMYFHALTQGLAALPQADAAIRAELDADAARDGWPAMHRRLAQHDPDTAARLAPNDAQRIQRALEILMVSGHTMSYWLARQKADANADASRSGATPPAPANAYTVISLEPSDRAVLHDRIAKRFDAMLEHGFIDEVRRLHARGDLHPDLASMRCVGYRQAWDYLEGRDDWPAMRDKGIFATRQLCKRQLTWLRKIGQRTVIDCVRDDIVDVASHAVIDALGRLRVAAAEH